MKLNRYGNKTNKCLQTFKRISYYIINIVCLLHVYKILLNVNMHSLNFIFIGPCIMRYQGGIYDQQDATNSQYTIYSSELLMMGNDGPKHVEKL
jgi:hypothetical protein